MTQDDRDRLVQAALAARDNAHAPYSKFFVGAALLANDGQFYVGVNVENASFGLTICAERVAMSTAIAAGQREFSAIAVASPGGVSPCGACRQFLAEFSEDMPVLLVNADSGAVRETSIDVLLPDRFSEF